MGRRTNSWPPSGPRHANVEVSTTGAPFDCRGRYEEQNTHAQSEAGSLRGFECGRQRQVVPQRALGRLSGRFSRVPLQGTTLQGGESPCHKVEGHADFGEHSKEGAARRTLTTGAMWLPRCRTHEGEDGLRAERRAHRSRERQEPLLAGGRLRPPRRQAHASRGGYRRPDRKGGDFPSIGPVMGSWHRRHAVCAIPKSWRAARRLREAR